MRKGMLVGSQTRVFLWIIALVHNTLPRASNIHEHAYREKDVLRFSTYI